MRRHAPETPRRLLVIANETVESAALRQALRASAADEPQTQVLVVAPALNTRLRHWLSDDDAARAAAGDRLRRSTEQLRRAGFDAEGCVGD